MPFRADLTPFISDHKNPEVAIQQILSIAPILQGQKPNSPKPKEESPKRKETVPQNGSENAGSLIDFGGDDDTMSPAQSTASKTKNQAALQGLLDESSDDNPQNNSGRARQSSLMAPLQPTLSPQRVKRVDSTNSDVDEFVDAHS